MQGSTRERPAWERDMMATGGRKRSWGSSSFSFFHKTTKARSLVLYASFLCFCCTTVAISMRWLYDCCSPSNGTTTTTTIEQRQNRHPLYTTAARPCGVDKPFWKNLTATHYRSQSGEDRHLLEYYFGFGEHMEGGQLCGGTYVELGALDGVTISNSHVFHTQYDWRGVLIELAPDNYKRLVVNRPGDTELVPPIHAAVCHDDDDADDDEEHTQHRTVHYIAQKDKFWGATSGIWEFMPPSFRATWWKDVQWEDLVPIRCSPLRQLFREYTPHVHFFDFLSLDVEGAELDALRSIDYGKTAFGAILVEADGHDRRKNLAVRLFLQRHGYVFVEDWGRSYWFVHPDFDIIYYNEQVMMSTSSSLSNSSSSKYENDGNVATAPAG